MKLKDLLAGLDIVASTANTDIEMSGISYDSRKTAPGEIFVAIRGYESDGHRYIADAVAKGAVCVLCENIPECDVPYIIIENSRKGLAVISANWFHNPAAEMKIIGVTGTNGKTTTTHLIKTIIETCTGAMTGLIGTNHNIIGDKVLYTEHSTPESFELQYLFREMADAGCKYAVMEVTSHSLVLDRVYGITFDVGMFLNLTQDHLDFHNTMEEYAAAKALLFSKSKLGIINIDDEYAQVMIDAATCPIYTFSADKDVADLVAKSIKLYPDKVEFCVLTIGVLERAELAIPGMFSVYNGLAAIAVALGIGIGLDDAINALQSCNGVMGRAEVVPTSRDFTILIDYAHSPDALKNILTMAREITAGRVVTLFGCGGDRDKTKRPLMGGIVAELSDFMIVTTDNPRTEDPAGIIEDILAGLESIQTPYVVIENRREAIGWAIQNAQTDDVIILAGKGHETYQIIGKERTHFDEREIVAEFLKN